MSRFVRIAVTCSALLGLAGFSGCSTEDTMGVTLDGGLGDFGDALGSVKLDSSVVVTDAGIVTPVECSESKPCIASPFACRRADCVANKCVLVNIADGTTCDDGKICTTGDSCRSGACAPSGLMACDDGLSCSTDSCDVTLGCVADKSKCGCEKHADCDDGNACNGAESCDLVAHLCKAGTKVDCGGVANACNDGMCNPATGACKAVPKANGTTCSDGSMCTKTDSCQAGACVGAAPVQCQAADSCHTAGVCDPANGQCSSPVRPNGSACDDKSLCTTGEICTAGACGGGTSRTCGAGGECQGPGVCNPATGQCSNPLLPEGTSCNDGQVCTSGDTCASGSCVGAPISCSDGLTCSVDSCSEAVGGCQNDSTPCSCDTDAECGDRNACNGIETCNLTTRTCQKGTAVTCTNLNDQCNIGSCVPATGACQAVPRQNGTACTDANSCTQADTCQAGACVGADPVICAASDQCHVAGTCNPLNGQCSNPEQQDGVTCDDTDACTQTDTCQTGACVGAEPVVCEASDQCHVAGTCDSESGRCSNPLQYNGTSCSDDNSCTNGDTCQAGSCSPGVSTVCQASDQCHVAGQCNPQNGQCSNPAQMDGFTCSDMNACTQSDTCQVGACVGANPVVCQAQDQCHVAGTCDTQTGTCSNPSANDGTTCTDNSACTPGDSCQAGSCVPGPAIVCTAQDQCHVAGTCDPQSGTCSNPIQMDGTTCDDLDYCSQTDTCQMGTCSGGNPVVCAAMDQCHVAGSCDPQSGFCSNPNADDGSTCTDNSACTPGDGCLSGTCIPGVAIVCNAYDQCHVAGTCDSQSGVCSNPAKPDNDPCTDGNACTQSDTCQAGSCSSGTPVVCGDPAICHGSGTCDTQTGLCAFPTLPDGTGCADGAACTSGDQCVSGTCVGTPFTCAPPGQCESAGVCDEFKGACSYTTAPDGTGCDDDNECYINDQCTQGSCSGTPRDNAAGDWNRTPPGDAQAGGYTASADHATLSDGTLAVAGSFGGTLDFGDGHTVSAGDGAIGAYFVRYDSTGTATGAHVAIEVTNGGLDLTPELEINDMALRSNGQYVLVGRATGGVTFTGGNEPVALATRTGFVALFDSDGATQWVRYVSGPNVNPLSVDLFNDNSLALAGHSTGDVALEDGVDGSVLAAGGGSFVATYSANGVLGFADNIADERLTRLEVATNRDLQSIGVIGAFGSSINVSGVGGGGVTLTAKGSLDAAFIELSDTGALVLAYRIGGPEFDMAGGIAAFRNGFALAIGSDGSDGGDADFSVPGAAAATSLHGDSTLGLQQTHVLTFDRPGWPGDTAVTVAASVIIGTQDTTPWDIRVDPGTDFVTVLGQFSDYTTVYSNVGTGSGFPEASSLTVNANILYGQPLFAARFLATSDALDVRWVRDLRGNFGLVADPELSIYADQSATAGGVFANSYEFGDVVTNTLITISNDPGSYFLSHFNSQAQYDYCRSRIIIGNQDQ